jgi:hypothetical protein
MPKKPVSKKLTAAAARKYPASALWARHDAITATFKDVRTADEIAELKVVKAELDRRATALFAPYFKGIF